MLADMNLDDENFEEIVEAAKNMIAGYYPEWTDYNYHDPGITIIELFAFLKEIQQYRINYIGEKHRMKYLKLLGVEREHMHPAIAAVCVQCSKTVILPELTGFYASGICFETRQAKYLISGDICCCIYESESGPVTVDREMMEFGKALRIPVFGGEPRENTCFYIGFDEALPEELELSIYADIYNDYKIMRNPIGEDIRFHPLSVLSLQYYDGRSWIPVSRISDRTYGFLQSGWMFFTLGGKMKPAKINGLQRYYLRIKLIQSMYDIPPVIRSIAMNMVIVEQKKHYARCQDLSYKIEGGRGTCVMEADSLNLDHITLLTGKNGFFEILEDYDYIQKEQEIQIRFGLDGLSELPDCIRVLSWNAMFDAGQILGEGDGLPCQEYMLNDNDLLYGSFSIMIEEAGQEGIFSDWKKVDDFTCSGVSDKHYIMDAVHGRLLFGDCIHGMAPEGRIIITQYVTSRGMDGNVTSGRINRIEPPYDDLIVINKEDAYGGRDEEDLEQCFIRAGKLIDTNEGLLTCEDYEAAVKKTPGLMIEGCKAIYDMDEGDAVTIVVKPFSLNKNPVLGRNYIENIKSWLEPIRMIGTSIRLSSPEYVKVNVFVEGNGRNNYLYDRKIIIEALDGYFAGMSGTFGGYISHSRVYGLLDRLPVLSTVSALSIDAVGNKVKRTYGGDVILPPNGVISLEDIQYNISINED